MAKTISVDDEAYKILKSHRLPGESFSDVIKKEMAEAVVGAELDKVLAQVYRKEKGARNGTSRR